MPTLYHLGFDTGSRFSRFALLECGVDHDLVEEAHWRRREEFLSLNPDGTVPVLQVGGAGAICGSMIIAEFICDCSDEGSTAQLLISDNITLRAEIRRLMSWFLVKMSTEATGPLARERIYKAEISGPDGGSPDPAVLRAARHNLSHHLDYIDYLVKTRDWLAGKTLSFADLSAAAALSIVDYLDEVDWSRHDAAKNWYARMKSRPALQMILKDRVAGFTPPVRYEDPDF